MIGKSIGPYQVLAKLGAGGMGEVWRARDARLDREVAIKVLPAHIAASPSKRERFAREARAASALVHPNIITIHEINAADGLDFIVMEYVRGETLAAALGRGRLPVESALDYATQIAAALAAAHHSGIVHRDLKPGNVMIAPGGLVKVLDFGIAKRMLDAPEHAQETTFEALTMAGDSIGTPSYMSPEQTLGDNVDARSDVFSFGIVLYEMLAGRLPFQSTSRLSLIRQIVHDPPAPILGVAPDLPAGVVAVVERCLAKDPAGRYANAAEVGDALRALAAQPTAVVARVGRPRRRAAGAILALALVVLAGVVWQSGPAALRWLRTVVTPPETLADMEAPPQELYRRATESLRLSYRDKHVDTAIAQLERALQLTPSYASADARLSLAFWRRNAQRPDPEWQKRALVHAERAVTSDSQLAVGHVAYGAALALTGDRDKAAAEFATAETLDPSNWELQWRLGDFVAAQKDPSRAEQHYRRAVAAGPREWETHSRLGVFLYQQARYGDAIQSFETMRGLAPDHPRVYANLAAAYHQVGRTDDAAALLQQALQTVPDSLTYSNLGTYLYFQGKYPEAVKAFEQAVKLNANLYTRWGNLGDALRMTLPGSDTMHQAYLRAIQLAEQALVPAPGDIGIQSSLAVYLVRDGQQQRALTAIENVLGQQALTPAVLFKATLVAELAGQRARALTLLQRALTGGYQLREIRAEPDLVGLRADPDYHRIVSKFEK
jgi:eukaryotic-like serine/threonine-protein kinase